MKRVRWVLLLSLGFLPAASVVPAGAASPATTALGSVPDAGLRESAEVALRSARLRFEAPRGADPAVCESLTLVDLEVSLRGERLPAEALIDLDRRRGPALHALLIDTSASMIGKLGFVRDAAAQYVEHLRPGVDRVLLATFDEDAILRQGATGDRGALLEALDRIRMGNATALHDALYYAIDELSTHDERPVVVLLTDGVDTASLYERDDVNALAEGREDLVVFTIGYQLPDIQAGRPGVASARRFLYNLARRTGGAFFDVPTASRLEPAYRRIRQMLASEATLTLRDPDPGAPGGKIRVRSLHASCAATVLRAESEPASSPAEPVAAPGVGGRLPLAPGAPVRVRHGLPGSNSVPESCAPLAGHELPDAAWFVETRPDRLTGCALDVVMDSGMLYSTLEVTRWEVNAWIDLRTRPFEIEAPPIAELPHRPVEVLDRLAAEVQRLGEGDVRASPLKRPAPAHARPFADVPGLINGRTFLDSRSTLARALFASPDYETWARGRMAETAESRRAALVETFRGIAPDLADADLDRIARASAAGRRIQRRLDEATEDDLRPYLAAWLGDVSAHDLFVEWEARHAQRLVRESGDSEFPAAWSALRRVFYVPSYARILTLLTPVHDRDQERIGFWRVVLPRASWFLPRVQDAERHPEYGDLPLDLIPHLPLGFLVVREQLTQYPEVGRRLREGGYRVSAVRYELQGKPFRHDPPRAFREARMTLVLESGEGGRLELVADMRTEPVAHDVSIERCAWIGELAELLPACRSTAIRVDGRSGAEAHGSGPADRLEANSEAAAD